MRVCVACVKNFTGHLAGEGGLNNSSGSRPTVHGELRIVQITSLQITSKGKVKSCFIEIDSLKQACIYIGGTGVEESYIFELVKCMCDYYYQSAEDHYEEWTLVDKLVRV